MSSYLCRRLFFIFTYFMFFYNIFIGIFSCLMRIIKSIILGALFLPRLDHSTLPRKFQQMDPGNFTYNFIMLGLIKIKIKWYCNVIQHSVWNMVEAFPSQCLKWFAWYNFRFRCILWIHAYWKYTYQSRCDGFH